MKYTSRDTQSNIQNLIEDIKSATHLWQPGSEADPGMILLKALAANVDVLSFNLDTQVDEMYLQSATQIKSIRRIGVANGYQPSWYRSPRTRICIKNTSEEEVKLDFSIPAAPNNQCFAAKNALDNLVSIPYFIIPKTNLKGTDTPTLQPAGSTDLLGPTDRIYRTAAQGNLKSNIVNPAMMNPDGHIVDSLPFRLPAQNVDEDLIWVQEVDGSLGFVRNWEHAGTSGFLDTSISKPMFQVTVDDYNNLVVLFNGAINTTIQERNLIRVFYLETYGVAGEISENTLELSKVPEEYQLRLVVTHPGNTLDMPDSSALTGKTPMTASEAAADARNWVNTQEAIITLKNFNSWIRRQPGMSTGIAVDCQKALELNWSIRYDENQDDELKSKKYLIPGEWETTNADFPNNMDTTGRTWDPLGDADLDFPHDFLVYKLMYFTVFNNFLSKWSDGENEYLTAEWSIQDPANPVPYRRYRPAEYVRELLRKNYLDIYNLTCSIDFGYARVFEWKVNGVIYTNVPVSVAEANSIIALVLAALRVKFNAANVEFGKLPKMMDIVTCVQEADERIQYFDAGLLNKPMIEWCPVRDAYNRTPNVNFVCDPDYFNHISFARFIDGDTENIPIGSEMSNISVATECILPEVR